MSFPKALVPFRGKTFLEHLLEITRRYAGSQIGWTRVVLGAQAGEIFAKLSLDPATVVLNPNWKAGQLSSIQAAIRSLPDNETDGIVLFLVDHPLISADLVDQLMQRFYESGSSIVLPTYRGKRGHPVIFARRLYGELLAAPAEEGARSVVWAHAADVLEIPTDEEGVVLNLNDADALSRAAKNL